MRTIDLWLVSLGLLAALAGCASAPVVYQAAASEQAIGYRAREVEAGLLQIRYTAPYLTSFDQTYAYAMYRAAELSQARGASRFVIIEGPINRAALARFAAGERPVHVVQPSDLASDAAEQRLRQEAMNRAMNVNPMIYIEGARLLQQPVTPPIQPYSFKPTVVEIVIRTEPRASDSLQSVFEVDSLLQNLKPKIQTSSQP